MFVLVALAGASRCLISVLTGFFLLFLARLSFTLAGGFLFLAILLIVSNGSLQKTAALASENTPNSAGAITETFQTLIQETDFETQEIPDSSLTVGQKKIVQVGKKGAIQTEIRNLIHQGREFTHDIVGKKQIPATAQIVAFGTKKNYSQLNVGGKSVYYWQKINMYSTSYDSSCPGCDGRTAIGMKTGYGVVAVDPKVIPLRTKLYIPGYGFAVAGDTGGSIKGNKIDLGFDNVKTGWWSARYTDVYLLSEL